MTGAHAGTSLSFTIVAAFATLMVMGGILAGPAILDCTHQDGSLGACLRGKVVQSGLLPEDEPAPTPALSSEVASTVLEASRNPGWIEANATEYETATPGVAQLHAARGDLGADGSAAGSLGAAVEIALDEGPGILAADGRAPQLAGPGGAIKLRADPAGSLSARGRAEAMVDPAAILLTPRPGAVSGSGRDGAAVPMFRVASAELRGASLATGSIGPTGQWSASTALGASLRPAALPVMPPALAPAPAVPPPVVQHRKPVAKPGVAKSRRAAKPPRSAEPSIKYDPHYPNVLVLPPPNGGANSSFATLEVR